ncbi:MraY family glycosyltransferase [Oceanithermus sp.]
MPTLLRHYLKSLGIADPTGSGWLTVVLTFMVAAVATWRSVPALVRFALRVGWADAPNERRLNREPLPNVGGLAVFGGVVLALTVALLLRPNVLDDVLLKLLVILFGGSLMVLLGFIDDQYGLPALFRLGVQVAGALLLYAGGVRIDATFGYPIDPALSVGLTVLWIVGITNAINLLDGVDGLAGGVSLITAIFLLAASAQFETRAAATLLLAAVAGAVLGFLRHNLHPSHIILGDAGAYFLGYVLAATAILGNLKISTVWALVPTALFLAIPILDTTQVFFRRLAARKNPLAHPGKDHLHHWLLARGLDQHRVAVVLWGLTLASGTLAMRVQGMSWAVTLTAAAGAALLLAFASWRRRRAARREP